MVNTKGVGKKNWHIISYPSIPSAIRPVPHCEKLPVLVFSGFYSSADIDDDQREHEGCNNKMVFESESFSDNTNRLSAPELFSQTELNDLVRDLRLSKKAEKILASRMLEKHVLYLMTLQKFHIFESETSLLRHFSQNRNSLFIVTIFLVCSGS